MPLVVLVDLQLCSVITCNSESRACAAGCNKKLNARKCCPTDPDSTRSNECILRSQCGRNIYLKQNYQVKSTS